MYPANRSQRMLSDARHALAPAQKIALAVRALPVVQPEERGKEAVVLEKIGSLCVTVNEMFGRLEDLFQIGTDLLGEALDPPANRLGTIRGELASNNAYFARW
jgi:hypothetical protein